MVIDKYFSDIISEMDLSREFIDTISEMYKAFCFQVMSDLTFFQYMPKSYSTFVGLGLASKEYALQKYFEPRIDTYIRDYLINGVVETLLEARDYDVSRPSLTDEDSQPDQYYQTKDYEQKVGFEFVTYDGKELVGYRFTDIQDYILERYLATRMVNRVVVVDWENPHGISEEEKKSKYWGEHGNQVRVVGYEDVFLELFGDNEGKAYNLFLKHVIKQFRNTLGVNTIPKLTSPILFQHRLEEENALKNKALDTDLRYQIIESYNTSKYPDLERQSRDLVEFAGLRERYLQRKLYKVLTGKGDYARSFLTSEYLYQQFNGNDMFDYTAIVSGYLKSVEQLIYRIILQYVDKKRPDDRFYRVGPDNKKVTLTSSHVNSDKISATMGNMIHFFRAYPETINVLDENRRQIFFDCMELYLDECRNQSFHKHNNYDWDRVERIRNNTFFMYQILLSVCVPLDELAYSKRFAVVEDDRLERLYYWLRKKEMYTFKVKMPGESQYFYATRSAEEKFPEFDEYGLLVDYFIPIGCSQDIHSPRSEYRYLEISRDCIPDEVWYTTYVSEYQIDFSL